VIDADNERRESVARALHLRWPELLVLEADDAEAALPMIAYARPVVVLLRDGGATPAAQALLQAAREANGGAVVALLAAAEEATRLKSAHGGIADYVGPLGRNAARLEALVVRALRAQRVSR
jgi:DNA-binding NarL/FixJ family response regulator